jgi:hypothetical protein
VASWMALLAAIMQLLSPVFSLGLFLVQPLTQTNPVRARAQVDKWVSAACMAPNLYPCGSQLVLDVNPVSTSSCQPWGPVQIQCVLSLRHMCVLLLQATQLPQGFWARLHYLWERPVVK